MDKLKKLLSIEPEAFENYKPGEVGNYKTQFDEIAKLLIEDYAIVKGQDCYFFTEIEFYFYAKNHQDIITHPRRCLAMQWYINNFGDIDLTFESHIEMVEVENSQKKVVCKPVLDDKCYFGGILIRGLKNVHTGKNLEGPWACSELYRLHSVDGLTGEFPKLIKISDLELNAPHMAENAVNRYNLLNNKTSENKVDYILSGYKNGAELSKDSLVNKFDEFLPAAYRYYAKDWKVLGLKYPYCRNKE